MLAKISALLNQAKKNGYGVPALGAVDELACHACIGAAEELNSPLILLCMQNGSPNLEEFGRLMNDLALKAKVPVATMYDHTSTFETAIEGIRCGFNTVMMDRSQLSFEENAARLKEFVRIAHSVGVEVEGELGHVGWGSNYAVDGASALTVPEEAVRFVAETGVDCLAVAVGTAHGIYKAKPQIHFELLERLAREVPVPLVLHGGSGTGDENLSQACKKGICKVNIVNDLYRGAYNAAVADGMEGNRIYNLFPVLMRGYKEVAMHFITVFGSAGKA